MKKIGILFFIVLAWAACNPCGDVDCGLHGTCEEGDCICDSGWTGTDCSINLCDDIDCEHGECDAGECVCDDGWGGDLCDECDLDCVHGACNDDGECVCDNGWEGTLCDEEIFQTAISVWTEMSVFPCNTTLIDVYISESEEDLVAGDYVGSLDSYYDNQPDCGANGTVTEVVTPGIWYVYAECNDGDMYWDGEIEVEEGECFMINLTEKKGLKFSAKKK